MQIHGLAFYCMPLIKDGDEARDGGHELVMGSRQGRVQQYAVSSHTFFFLQQEELVSRMHQVQQVHHASE